MLFSFANDWLLWRALNSHPLLFKETTDEELKIRGRGRKMARKTMKDAAGSNDWRYSSLLTEEVCCRVGPRGKQSAVSQLCYWNKLTVG